MRGAGVAEAFASHVEFAEETDGVESASRVVDRGSVLVVLNKIGIDFEFGSYVGLRFIFQRMI